MQKMEIGSIRELNLRQLEHFQTRRENKGMGSNITEMSLLKKWTKNSQIRNQNGILLQR